MATNDEQNRNTMIRSVSFDPQVFDAMEDQRAKLRMDRSEFIMRCILKQLASGETGMTIGEVPESVLKPMKTAKQPRRKKDK